jgi:CheY-like chemotaxis protein/phosphoribosyl 1,2-cyclic phosphodiesterase
MKVRFWGTRGSIATPGPGTNHFGGNTSCVELTSCAGERLILDCGTGAQPLAAALMAEAGGAIHSNILLGHTHWDHIQGFPFFTPAFVKGNSAAIYGPQGNRVSLREVLAGQMEYTYFPIELNQLPAAINYHELNEGVHQISGMRVTTQFINHPAITVGYRIEADGVAVVYLVDHEPFSSQLWRAGAEPGRLEAILHDGDRRHAAFMAGADLVIHDAQYTPAEYQTRLTWGHSSYDYAVQLAAAAGARRLALTHHDPGHNDRAVAAIEASARRLAAETGSRLDVFCAYEGCEVEIAAQAIAQPFVAAPAVEVPVLVPPHHAHILVVDDHAASLLLVVRTLEREQYVVSTATSGAEALQMIDAELPDLLVLDYKMAGMNGLEVMQMLRAKPETQALPVLMLTGMNDEPSTRAGFDAGVTDYVTKPFSIPQLVARVRACLARTRQP